MLCMFVLLRAESDDVDDIPLNNPRFRHDAAKTKLDTRSQRSHSFGETKLTEMKLPIT